MADSNEKYTDAYNKRLLHNIGEMGFRTLIEDGSIEIAGRDPVDIVEEYKAIILKGGIEWRGIRDHRDTLLTRARAEAEERHDEVAVILYATWMEHSINGILVLAFEREGHTAEVVTPLIRELRLQTKASALWRIAGLRDIGEENLTFLGQVSEFRNSLVHYKWQAHDLDLLHQRSVQLRSIIERVEELVDVLLSIETDTFWDGRETEIIEYFREDSARRGIWPGDR